MFADTAPLIALLKLDDRFSGPLKNANKTLGQFDANLSKTSNRAYKAGQQIGTGIQNGVKLAVVGLAAIGALLLKSAKEGQEAANVQKIYATAIQNSGKVTAAQVVALNAQQQALLDLAGVDDELIKTEQTRLIQMGLTGDQILKITPLILDFAKANNVDLLTATKLVGKSVEGNTGALSRYGVIVDKTKAKTDPFVATQDALNKSFGGTTKALSGSLDTRLAVVRERLANIREEAGLRLLPGLTRIVDVVGRKLVPAFGTFIDRILPSAIKGLDKLAGFLEGGGATDTIDTFLRTAKSLAPAIQKSAEITSKVIGTAVNLFKSLPPEIQSLAIAGLAVNKLTGGLVTNIAGGLISAVISSFKGLMNVNAAVVNVNGPISGLPGGGGGGKPGVPPLLPGALALATLPFVLKGDTPGTQVNSDGSIRSQVVGDSPDYQRKLLAAQKAAASGDSKNALQTEQAIARNAKAVVAATRAAAQRFTAAIKDQDSSVTVNVPVSTKTYVNGRLLQADTGRFTTTIVGHKGATAEFG